MGELVDEGCELLMGQGVGEVLAVTEIRGNLEWRSGAGDALF